MSAVSLSLRQTGALPLSAPLARYADAGLYARFDDTYGMGGIYYADGSIRTLSDILDTPTAGQPTDEGLFVADGYTNLLLESRCDQFFVAHGAPHVSVLDQVTYLEQSTSELTFMDTLTPGQANARVDRAGKAAQLTSGQSYTHTLEIALSRPLEDGERLKVLFTGFSGSIRQTIDAANSTAFVGQFGRLSSPQMTAGSGGVYPVIYIDAPLTGGDLKVYVHKGASVVGNVALPWIETFASPVAVAPSSPTLVQGGGGVPFLGAASANELTLAMEWEGITPGTGTERGLMNIQAHSDYGVTGNNRAYLFFYSDGALNLGIADTSWQGGINAGSSTDDGGCHHAIVYLNRLTGDIALSVDGAPFLTANKVGLMPSSFDIIGLGHKKAGAVPSHQSGGYHLEIAAASGDHREVWR